MEDGIAVTDIHEHEVSDARHILQAHGGELRFQISAPFVGQFSRVAHMLLVEKSCKGAGLGDAIGIEWLTSPLKHCRQLGRGDAVTDTEIRKAHDL